MSMMGPCRRCGRRKLSCHWYRGRRASVQGMCRACALHVLQCERRIHETAERLAAREAERLDPSDAGLLAAWSGHDWYRDLGGEG